MPRRIEPDDEVGRFRSVFLGPTGWTMPFHARYAAYGYFVAFFALICLVKAVTPMEVGKPVPLWEAVIAVFASSLLMTAVDGDKSGYDVVRHLLRNGVTYLHRKPKPIAATFTPSTKRHMNRDRHAPQHHRSLRQQAALADHTR